MTENESLRRFYAHIWPQRALVVRTAQFLSRDAALADDLAQETLLKAFQSIQQFDPATSAKAWLSAILRHTWIDHLRASGRQTALSLEQEDLDVAAKPAGEAPADAHNPAALLERFSDAHMIAALQELPNEIRWTLLLVDVEQMNHEDAAKILEVPVGTVKSRAHRGRNMLRQRLAATGSAPRAIAGEERS